MARSWSIPTLAKRVEQFVSDRGLIDTSTIADLRAEFKEAVWDAAITSDDPAPKPKSQTKSQTKREALN